MNRAELAEKWLAKAENDLLVSRHVLFHLKPRQIDISCYHSQQCGEKSLKAFLVAQGLDPPRTHDLVSLCQKCADVENGFLTLLDDCADLTIHSVTTRYPYEMETSPEDAEAALENADRVYQYVLRKIRLRDKA